MTISQYYEIDWYSRRECQVGTEVRLEIIVVLRRRSRSKTEVRSGSRLQFQRLFYCTRSKWYSYCVSSFSLFLIETADEARVSNWSLYTIDNQLMHAILLVRDPNDTRIASAVVRSSWSKQLMKHASAIGRSTRSTISWCTRFYTSVDNTTMTRIIVSARMPSRNTLWSDLKYRGLKKK